MTTPAIHLFGAPSRLVRKPSTSLPKPPAIAAHIITAATMNSAGMVKLRKFSMPMTSVKATATIT